MVTEELTITREQIAVSWRGSPMNIKFAATVFALMTSAGFTSYAQAKPCMAVSFSASVSGTEKYVREIGGGLWFTVYGDTLNPGGSWTMRIGEGQSQTERFDIGWSLGRGWTENWELGPTRGRDAEAAMKLSPRLLWFAISKSDLERLRAAQYRQISSNSRVIFSGESDPNKVIASIPKGLVSVSIIEYRLTEPEMGKKREVVSVAFSVTVTVPTGFPLLDGVSATCPSFSLSKSDTAM
jgi:hypothetical protein